MRMKNWLQFFAEGASAGDGGAAGVTSADAGQNTGVTTDAAGQSFEDRLEQLGVPKDKIRKGAYKGKTVPAAAKPAVQEQTAEPSGDADRKSWDEIRAEYKADFDAEVQNIVQQRVKKEQERAQQYVERDSKLSPMVDFFAHRYGLDAENLDYDQLLEKFRGDNSLSQDRAAEMGTSEDVAHKLDLAEIAEEKRARAEKARQQQLAEAFQRQQWASHIAGLREQGEALKKKIPGFDLDAEMQNASFRLMTDPYNKIPVEQAYYALHPEYRQAEAQAVAQKATEAVASSVRAGQTRPTENGAQAATISKPSYRDMSKKDRDALKQRIYAAGYEGRHLKPGE